VSRVLVVGAGLSGLAFAWEYATRRPDSEVHVVEAESTVGGLCRTVNDGGYMFDYTGHLLHFAHPWTRPWVEGFGVELSAWDRHAAVLMDGRLIPYPFQNHLYFADDRMVEDCLVGLVDRPPLDRPELFESRARSIFGDGIVNAFMLPYNEKITSLPSSEIAADWMGRFFPEPDVRRVVSGALRPGGQEDGYNAQFWYPTSGIGTLTEGIARSLPPNAKVSLDTAMLGLDARARTAELTGSRVEEWDSAVVTAPLDQVALAVTGVSSDVAQGASVLRVASVLNLNLGLRECAPPGVHWVYVPEPKECIYRLGFASNFCPAAAPEGCCSVYVEASHLGSSGPSLDEVRASAFRALRDLGMRIPPSAVEVERVFKLEHAYVAHDLRRERGSGIAIEGLRRMDVHMLGRYGRWDYSSMEDAIVGARALAIELSRRDGFL
jgi:protoporphyrinogen oxidase